MGAGDLDVFLWAVIHGGLRDDGGGQVKNGFAVHGGGDAIALIKLSDDGMAQLPFIENGFYGFLFGGLNGKEHTLLAFREHDIMRGEIRHPQRDTVKLQFN